MNKEWIDLLTKAGAAGVLAWLLYFNLKQTHESRAMTDARLHMLMERQANAVEASQEALETLVRIYSGD